MTNFVNSEDVKNLFISLNEKPIVYHRAYAKITGSVTAGLLLSQIVYWWTTMQDQEFYKTNEDFRRELAMGDYELKAAKKKLKEMDLVFITRKGIPAKTYYMPNISQIITRLTSWVETAQLIQRVHRE